MALKQFLIARESGAFPSTFTKIRPLHFCKYPPHAVHIIGRRLLSSMHFLPLASPHIGICSWPSAEQLVSIFASILYGKPFYVSWRSSTSVNWASLPTLSAGTMSTIMQSMYITIAISLATCLYPPCMILLSPFSLPIADAPLTLYYSTHRPPLKSSLLLPCISPPNRWFYHSLIYPLVPRFCKSWFRPSFQKLFFG